METQETRLRLVPDGAPSTSEKIAKSDLREELKQRMIRTAMRKAFEEVLHEVADGDRDADLWEGLQIANLKSDYISVSLVATLNHRYNGSIGSLFDRMYEIIHSDKKIPTSNLSA